VTDKEELNVTGMRVWAGIWTGGVIGLFFHRVHSWLLTITLNEQRLDLGSVVWQLDVAAPHLGHFVFNFWDEKFSVWIGQWRQVACPP